MNQIDKLPLIRPGGSLSPLCEQLCSITSGHEPILSIKVLFPFYTPCPSLTIGFWLKAVIHSTFSVLEESS